MRIAVKLWCVATLAASGAACCFAQTTTQTTKPQARDFTLLEGHGELLTFQRDVTKLVLRLASQLYQCGGVTI